MEIDYMEPISYEIAKILVPDIRDDCRYFMYTTMTSTVIVAKDPNFDDTKRTAMDDGTYEYVLEELPRESASLYREPITTTRNRNLDKNYKVVKLCILMFCIACACIAYKLLLTIS